MVSAWIVRDCALEPAGDEDDGDFDEAEHGPEDDPSLPPEFEALSEDRFGQQPHGSEGDPDSKVLEFGELVVVEQQERHANDEHRVDGQDHRQEVRPRHRS